MKTVLRWMKEDLVKEGIKASGKVNRYALKKGWLKVLKLSASTTLWLTDRLNKSVERA